MNSNNQPSTSAQTEKCPKCGASTTVEGICEQCGWAIIHFPAVIPDVLSAFEEKRAQAAEKSNSSLTKLKAQQDNLSKEKQALDKKVTDLERQLDEARAASTTATPRAFLILTNESDPDELSAVAIGSGATRVANPRVARNNPSFSGQVLRMMTAVEVDFTIELSQSGRFRVRDNAGTLLVNRVATGDKATQITNGDTLTFKGINGISLKFSIVRSR